MSRWMLTKNVDIHGGYDAKSAAYCRSVIDASFEMGRSERKTKSAHQCPVRHRKTYMLA